MSGSAGDWPAADLPVGRGTPIPPLRLNLLRLFRFHALDNADASALLGSTRHTVGDWLSGKRAPGTDYLMTIATLFGVDPRDLYSDPRDFAAVLADRARLDAMNVLEWRRRGWTLDDYGIAYKYAD